MVSVICIDIICPNCNSDFVVEIVETTSTAAAAKEAPAGIAAATTPNAIAEVLAVANDREGLEKTESQSSIGKLQINVFLCCYFYCFGLGLWFFCGII